MRLRRNRAIVSVAAAAIALIGGMLLAATYYHVPDAIQHHLSRDEQLNGAYLQPPGLLHWPRLAYGSVLGRCTLCGSSRAETAPSVQLAWLTRDESLAGLVNSNAPNRPHSAAEVPLPRLVWLVEWSAPCWSAQSPARACTTYDIVDDQTGLELDASQLAIG